MEMLKVMNVAFNEHNIFFKYKGMTVINNSLITNNGTPGNIFSLGFDDNNYHNIYVVNNAYLTGGTQASAYAFRQNNFAVFFMVH